MGRLCCVTTHYNPAGYRARVRNYHVFADRLAAQGVRLVTVELAFADRPFELPEAGTIRLRSDGVLWQKERLINHALVALPPEVELVAWLDADLLFPDADWADRVAAALDGFDVVQLFSRVRQLAPGATRPDGEAIGTDGGLVAQVAEFPDWVERRKAGRLPFAVPGYGWAARRAALGAGLYDRLILGSGDCFLADALLGSFGMHHYWHARTPGMAADMEAWLARFRAAGARRVGHVAGDVCHLWHGRYEDRRYRERDAILVRHAFDPAADVACRGGAYGWASDKPGLHAEVREYFLARAEDVALLSEPGA